MKDYIILLRDILLSERYVALQWTGQAASDDDAYERFVASSTFDANMEKREDFLILQVTWDERIAVEKWDDGNRPQSEYPLKLPDIS